MQTIELGQQFNKPFVIALGFFDCMHLGHRALLNEAKSIADKYNCMVAMFTFSNNHFKVLGKDTKLIYTIEERRQIFEDLGVDLTVCSVFDKNFMAMKSEEFLGRLFSYDIKGVVCGFDYSCGSDIAKSSDVVRYCNGKGVECHVVGEVTVGGEKVSSTLVRNLLTSGNVEKANKLLSQDFFICGTVVHGRGVGHTIGFPTANVAVAADKLLPVGVYGGYVYIDGVRHKAIVNIGSKPTFDVDNQTLEAHILDFAQDIYGKHIKVSVVEYLRGISKFSSVEQLCNQLRQDLKRVRLYD